MARVDVPTLQCDRCKAETQDLAEMGRFQRVEHFHVSGKDAWDLCPECWGLFIDFINEPTEEPPG